MFFKKWLGKLKKKQERRSFKKQKQEMVKRVAKDKKLAAFIMNKFRAPGRPKQKYEDLSMDFDSILTYMSTKNLVKHSKTLTWLTIGLIVLGLGMIGLAIAQLV